MTSGGLKVDVDAVTWVRVNVPIASFGIPFAREFIESYPFPPPATVYGMILSYIGEVDRDAYKGTQLAIVVTQSALPSLVLRKIRRVKRSNLNDEQNSKPELQTLLSGLGFLVAVANDGKLAKRLVQVSEQPLSTMRFGGLSCGESHNLVDEFSVVTDAEAQTWMDQADAYVVQPDSQGEWSVPVWVDHVGTRGTVWARASFVPADMVSEIRVFEIHPTQ